MALDLLQNGGITSGNRVFLVVFWTLHVNAKDLVMNLVYKNWLGCFRNTLAACCAFASEFGCFGATSLFSLDVHDVFRQLVRLVFNNGSKRFFLLRFAFSEAACRFSTTLWTRRMLLEFVRSLR